MKKYIGLTILLVLLVLANVACVKEEFDAPSTPLEEAEFVFEAQEVKGAPKTAHPAPITKTVTFVLDDDSLYDIVIPNDLRYFTNYATFIYGLDGSVTISLVSGVNESNFSKGVAIDDPENITASLIKTKDGYEGPQECAIFLEDGKAVVARCYNNPVAFATILQGFANNNDREPTRRDEVVTVKDYTVWLESLPTYTGDYQNVISLGVDYSESKQYYFDDGFLLIAQELKRFETSKKYNNLRLSCASGLTRIDKIYEVEGSIYWIEAGDFFACVIQENFNTMRAFFGKGDEARANMSDYLATI
jgi:hypothetical protein